MYSFKFNDKYYLNYSLEDIDALVERLGITEEDKNSILNESTNKGVVLQRSAAYKAESDPLYMEWQFDQTTDSEQAWRDKVTEIKARYPLVEA